MTSLWRHLWTTYRRYRVFLLSECAKLLVWKVLKIDGSYHNRQITNLLHVICERWSEVNRYQRSVLCNAMHCYAMHLLAWIKFCLHSCCPLLFTHFSAVKAFHFITTGKKKRGRQTFLVIHYIFIRNWHKWLLHLQNILCVMFRAKSFTSGTYVPKITYLSKPMITVYWVLEPWISWPQSSTETNDFRIMSYYKGMHQWKGQRVSVGGHVEQRKLPMYSVFDTGLNTYSQAFQFNHMLRVLLVKLIS